jgi:2-keto-4-pentenoate hydratase/2-oxohepta-3-ene-1,7-dioic acid hydratase in catechol pathway
MKLAFIDDYKFSVIEGDQVFDVSAAVSDLIALPPQKLLSTVITEWETRRGALSAAVRSGQGRAFSAVRFRSPTPEPRTIDCMAVNYMEDGTRAEPAPINAFHKSPSAVIGDGDTMVLPDVPAIVFEGEAEMALVIGRVAKNVSAAEAMQYIFGYMNFIDGSARGLPPAGNTFFQTKSRETFAPMGPYIVTADEIPDPQALQVKLWVNGHLMQNYNTSDMAHKIPRCIEWISSIHTLYPGDVLALGTNHRGLNAFQDGDRVELETQGLGRLHINVSDPLKRTWSRETRLERAEKKLEGLTPQLTGKYAKV